MELTILDEMMHQNTKEILIVTSRGSQFQISEGRDGTLVVAAGMPLEVEPYSFGTIVVRQIETSIGLAKKEVKNG